jgi:hypothetical protein
MSQPPSASRGCASCGRVLASHDTHAFCIKCLGTQHVVLGCKLCDAMPRKARVLRRHRVCLWRVTATASPPSHAPLSDLRSQLSQYVEACSSRHLTADPEAMRLFRKACRAAPLEYPGHVPSTPGSVQESTFGSLLDTPRGPGVTPGCSPRLRPWVHLPRHQLSLWDRRRLGPSDPASPRPDLGT